MTTAHRPTFNPARGGTARGEGDLSKLSAQYSSKDMPSHTKMKYRQPGQGTEEEIRKRDLRKELEDKERNAVRERRAREGHSSSSTHSSSKRPRMDQIADSAAVDADDAVDDADSSDDDSDDEDAAALMAELEKIKKERAEEKAKIEEKQKDEEEKTRFENIMNGNPLLDIGTSSTEFNVKRRWDDDVVFKNCAKGIDERKKEVHFINDAIRSEFHKKFMDKYIK